MHTVRLFTLMLAACLLAGCENPDQKANAMFVEAAQALTSAHATTDTLTQYEQLTAAKQAVSNIVTGYPGSSAAVRISANEKIGPYSLAELNAAIADLAKRPELCLSALTRACFSDMVFSSIDTLVKLPPGQRPDESLIHLTLGGLPFANIVARDRVQALFAKIPEGTKANTELMSATFGYPPITPLLLRMIGSVGGEQAIVKAIAPLNAIPGFQDIATKELGRMTYFFLHPRTPDSARLLRATANAILQPLPDNIARNLTNSICKLSTTTEENTIALADCTPAELADDNTIFGYISYDMPEKIYAAASTPEKKLDIANSMFSSSKLTLEQRLAWLERSRYVADFGTLADLYVQTTREGNPARTSIIQKVEQAAEKDLDNSALTQAGLTAKAIILLHANGTLAGQLPAIYQNIEAQPHYSEQLYRVLLYLARLQPLTPGMDQMFFYGVAGKALAQWPDDRNASKNAIRGSAVSAYPTDADPRPAYDAIYAGKPYASGMGVDTVLRFKAHGHVDVFDAAVAASESEEKVHSLRYTLARQSILDLAKAGDLTGALAKLEPLSMMTRYYVMGHAMQDNDLLPKPVRDSLREKLLEKYAYELTAYELGWKEDLGVPVQLKLDTISAHYTKITEFIGDSPADWLVQTFSTFTPAQRTQALKAMHQAEDRLWPVYASAIVLVGQE